MKHVRRQQSKGVEQNCHINSLVSSQSEIDLNVSCDAQNSEPPLLWNSVYPQSLRRLVLELDLSASIAEVDQQA